MYSRWMHALNLTNIFGHISMLGYTISILNYLCNLFSCIRVDLIHGAHCMHASIYGELQTNTYYTIRLLLMVIVLIIYSARSPIFSIINVEVSECAILRNSSKAAIDFAAFLHRNKIKKSSLGD